jgi:hypothetical protein
MELALTTNVHLPETAVVHTELDTCPDASWEVWLVHLPNWTEPSRIPLGSQLVQRECKPLTTPDFHAHSA